MDNVFLNFHTDHLETGTIITKTIDYNISDHSAQIIYFKSDYQKVSLEKRSFRPITQIGLHKFYSIVENMSWVFANDLNVNIDNKFKILMDSLEEAYLRSFPERIFAVRSDQPNRVSWFDDNLKGMREVLCFLNDVCKQYNRVSDIKEYKNYKLIYRQAIKDAKRLANDRAINTAVNPVKCMWGIINKKGVTGGEISGTVKYHHKILMFFFQM